MCVWVLGIGSGGLKLVVYDLMYLGGMCVVCVCIGRFFWVLATLTISFV